MQLPKELLAESNYEGTRLIEVTNEDTKVFQGELDALQKELNPILDKLSTEYYQVIDPKYQRVQELHAEIKELKEEISEMTKTFEAEIKKIEELEQSAQLIKNKMSPIILSEVEGQLGEFEVARHTVVKDGKIYVEIFDELEEKIKAMRAAKEANNAKTK